MKQIGIQLNQSLDVAITPVRLQGLITSGLMLGNTLNQNVYIIMRAQKGDNKEHPLLGVGIEDMTGDNDPLFWKRAIREELAKDGMRVQTLSVSDSKIIVKAEYL